MGSDTSDVGNIGIVSPTHIQEARKLDQPVEGPDVPATVVVRPPRYQVMAGQNLADIAHLVYGNANAWSVLYNANLKRIDNPSQLLPGTMLDVPPR